MPEKTAIRELLAESGPIVDQLIDVITTAKKAFIHQRGQLLIQLNNQQDPLCRKIESTIAALIERMSGKYGSEREPYLRLHSIVTHLLIIAETTCHLEDTLQKQIKDAVLFSDKAISQVNDIFDRQTAILGCLADVICNDDKEARHKALEECQKLGHFCLQYATDHESRLVEGLCFPQSAPLFLAILDQMLTIAHHEREIALLLGSNF